MRPPFKPAESGVAHLQVLTHIGQGVALWAALGETELMQGIGTEEALPVQMSLVYKIVAYAGLSHAEISALLDKGEKLVTSWS